MKIKLKKKSSIKRYGLKNMLIIYPIKKLDKCSHDSDEPLYVGFILPEFFD
jgi:hypothetical protein